MIQTKVVLYFSRSKDVIEPIPKPQWYVACDEMAARAVKVRLAKCYFAEF